MKRIILGLLFVVVMGLGYRLVWFDRPPGSLTGPVEVAPVADWLGWTSYGADPGQSRYVPLAQITPANVRHLKPVWQYRTGAAKRRAEEMKNSAFQATPILAAGHLVLCTPFNRVIALDPETGKERWVYDPEIPSDLNPANKHVCRGVSQWVGPQPDTLCGHRILTATNDLRLIALDARTGTPCPDFGEGGEVVIHPGMALRWPGEMQITSPPAIAGDVVIVGSAISDNVRVEAPSGVVRAFDVRSGVPLWAFDPIPREADDPARADWPDDHRTGHANVWSTMSVDEALGLVYLPTSSPSPDFWGGLRKGDNRYANSVVALDAATGAVRWHFQTVHHDVWDYDVPAGPSLIDLPHDGTMLKALVQPTKTGFLFVLDRQTGAPLFPIEERAVPQANVWGEHLSDTQPFPTLPPAIAPQGISPDDAFGLAFFDKAACREAMEKAGASELFTPPDEDGALLVPFTGGGVNWGGASVDPDRKIVIGNTSRAVHLITLLRRGENPKADQLRVGRQEGAAYAMTREVLLSPLGLPCNPPPWGALSAVDLITGQKLWDVPLGTTRKIAGPVSLKLGTPNLGGSLITQSGLIFIGAAMDQYLRAFDIETGAELWGASLPAGGQATPMSYAIGGRQYVVIAAGGHTEAGTALGDHVIAFALP